MPNPANDYVTVNVFAERNKEATMMLIDKVGRRVLVQKEKLSKGFNNISLNIDRFSEGVYALVIEIDAEKIIKQLIIVR